MYRQFTVQMSRRLRGVVPTDPAGAPSAPGTVALSPAEMQMQREAEQVRQLRAEQQAVQRVLTGLGQAVGQLHERQQQLIGEVQKATIELALAIASWLLRKNVETGDYPLEAIVREALERLGPQRPVTIFLHPDDLRLLESRVAGPVLPQAGEIALKADATLARGNVQARAGEIEVLSRLDEHLATIRKHLLGELDHVEPAARAASVTHHRS